MSQKRWIIAGGLVVLTILVAVVFVVKRDTPTAPGEAREPLFSFAPNGARWETEASRSGQVSAAGLTIGRVAIAPLAPAGFDGSWTVEATPAVHTLRANGKVGESDAKFEWWVPRNNPHTAFAGTWTTTIAALRDAPPTSSIKLPAGELTYVNAAYETVPFAGKEVVIPRIAAGPIVWRSGAETVTFWQWSADRVTINEAEEGGVRIDFAWWHPEHHAFPAECAEELGSVPVQPRVSLGISFDGVESVTPARLADGATGAAVAVFFDPSELEDARYREGAATSPSDYLARARTIALGHSDPGDARHGNGGLAGTGVGGTVLVPAQFADETARVEELRASLQDTTVELALDHELMPRTCADWVKAIQEKTAVLGPTTTFDGAFPNLLGVDGLASAPAGGPHAYVWPAVELTGRRKDVVQQTLSRTYLDRLEKRRGIAVLRIPLVATRNPLVPAAAESLLAPERQGNWTIEEEVSRALAEIELLAEERHFDLTSLQDLSEHLAASADVRATVTVDGALELVNPGTEPVRGYTLITDGAVVPVLGSGEAVSHEVRDVPGGRQQTWVWFDLPPGKTTLRLERPNAPAPAPIAWMVAEPRD